MSDNTDMKEEEVLLSRPIQPPLSRLDVLEQFLNVSKWTNLGDGDLMIGLTTRKRSADDASSSTFYTANDTASEAHSEPSESSLLTRVATESEVKDAIHLDNGKRRKRLTLSKQALDLADAALASSHQQNSEKPVSDNITGVQVQFSEPLGGDNEDHGNTMQVARSTSLQSHLKDLDNVKRRSRPFEDDDSADEGYSAGRSPGASDAIPKDVENGVRVMTVLTQVRDRTTVRLDGQDERGYNPTKHRLAEQSAAQAKARDEVEGAERSRHLREKKRSGLNNQGFGGEIETYAPVQLPAPEQAINEDPTPTFDDGSSFGRFVGTDFRRGNGSGNSHKYRGGQNGGEDRRSQLDHTQRLPTNRRARITESDLEEDSDVARGRYDTILSDSRSRDVPNYSPSDHEEQIDLSRRRYDTRPPDARSRNVSTYPPRGTQGNHRGFHPASREAANQWRTQNRHLDGGEDRFGAVIVAKGDDNAESRLRALTQRKKSHKTSNEPLPLPTYADDAAEKLANKSYDIGTDLRRSFAKLQPPRPRNSDSSSNSSVEAANESSNVTTYQRSTTPREAPQVPTIPIGTCVEIDLQSYEEVAREHERLKSQMKDLVALKEAFSAVATLEYFVTLNDKEEDHLEELKSFMKPVVDQGKDGARRRHRAQAIRDMMRRRLNPDWGEPDATAVEANYVALFGGNRSSVVDSALAQLEEYAPVLREIRYKLSARRNASKTTKKDGPPTKLTKKQIEAAKEEEQKLQEAKQKLGFNDRKHSELTTDVRNAPDPQAGRQEVATRPIQDDHNDESDVSEETEGEDNYAGVRGNQLKRSHLTNPQPTLNTPSNSATTPSNEQQQESRNTMESDNDEESPSRRPVLQQPHSGLLKENMKRQKKYDRARPIGDIEDRSLSAPKPNEIVPMFKYTVMGSFTGCQTYPNGKYSFKSYHSKDRAKTHVDEIISDLQLEMRVFYGDEGEVTRETRNGKYERMLHTGENDMVHAIVWIDKELIYVDVENTTYSEAVKERLRASRSVYLVEWEKTITTTEPAVVASSTATTTASPAADNEDDLFGHSRSPTPIPASAQATDPVITTEVIHPKPRDFYPFDCASSANQVAKTLYMRWYEQFDADFVAARAMPRDTYSIGYTGMLAHLNNALEIEVEELGDVGCWQQEGEYPHADGRLEKYEIWVRKVPVQGPSN